MSLQSLDANYTASQLVQSVHQFPHLSPIFEPESNDFGYKYDDDLWGNTYMESLLTFPVLCAVGAVLIIQAAYLVTLCTVYFYRVRDIQFTNCSTGNIFLFGCERNTTHGQERAPVNRMICSHDMIQHFNRIFLVVACLLAVTVFVCAQTVVLGNISISASINSVGDAVQYAEDTFNTLIQYSDYLWSNGDNIQSNVDQILANHATVSAADPDATDDCAKTADLLVPVLDAYFSSIEEFRAAVKPLEGQYADIAGQFYFWTILSNGALIWSSYALILAPLLLFGGGTFVIKKNKFLWGAIFCTAMVVMALLGFWTLEFIVLMGTSDFCVAPKQNMLRAVPASVHDDVLYFSHCAGQDPYEAYVYDSHRFIGDATSLVTAVIDASQSASSTIQCAADNLPLLSEIVGILDSIDSNVEEIADLSDCEAAKAHVDAALYDGLCSNAFEGLFTVWVGQASSAVFLVLLTLLYIVAVGLNSIASDDLFDLLCARSCSSSSSSSSRSSSAIGGGSSAVSASTALGSGSGSAMYEMVPMDSDSIHSSDGAMSNSDKGVHTATSTTNNSRSNIKQYDELPAAAAESP